MPKPRNIENQGLPSRWVYKHGAYYYRPKPEHIKAWGKRFYWLGKDLETAKQAYVEKLQQLTPEGVTMALVDSKQILASALTEITFIYFLIHNGVIVYVGKTQNLAGRLSSHARDKEYSQVSAITVPADKADLIEIAYISKFAPMYNTEHTGKSTPELYGIEE